MKVDNSDKKIFSSIIEIDNSGKHRFHLRFLEDGRALLVIDAKFSMYLNEMAAEFIKLFILGKTEKEIQKLISRKYNVKKKEILEDYHSIIQKIKLILSEDESLTLDDIGLIPTASKQKIGFPLRVDIALTYNCNNKCEHCYVPENILNNFPQEYNKEKIKKILDKLWEIGVPHVAFTGGECSLRDDLIDIISYAHEKGFVTGVISNGRLFSNKDLVVHAIDSGLEYIQITLESSNPDVHDEMQGIKGAWSETITAIKNFADINRIHFMTNTTICRKNLDSLDDTLELLKDLGIKVFAMNGLIYSGKGKDYGDALLESELEPILNKIIQKSKELNMRFIWYSPTQYCVYNPLENGLGPKSCSAASTSMGLMPNGDCIPCQSYFKPVGNILNDTWENIWDSELFMSIRNHEYIEKKCEECPTLDICGGGCPLFVKEKDKKIRII